MTVGIVGLGLIGGSAARAYSLSGHRVLAFDIDEAILSFAEIAGASAGKLSKENFGECELILIAIPPVAAVKYFEEVAPYIAKPALVIDFCGTKKDICAAGFRLAEEYGFTYVGGHPMAGTHHSGFKYSRADLFKGAPMVIVPPRYDDINLFFRVDTALKPLAFKGISVTTASEHDEIIAFTSQLAHVVSNAYVKSPTALKHTGFSAGSYQDLTRVARLNPRMWAELFLQNTENLTFEIDELIGHLTEYKDAIKNNDQERLINLLSLGSRIKKEIDGE